MCKFDFGGIVLLMLMLGVLIVLLIEGCEVGWLVWVWGLLFVVFVFVVFFWCYECWFGCCGGVLLFDLVVLCVLGLGCVLLIVLLLYLIGVFFLLFLVYL